MAWSMGLLGASIPTSVVAGAYDLLVTSILSADEPSITFNNLNTYAADYEHLQLRMVVQNTQTATTLTRVDMQFNNDTAGNYAYHRLHAQGTSPVTSGNSPNATFISFADILPRVSETGVFGGLIVDILDPFNSNKNTTTRGLATAWASGEKTMTLGGGFWNNTNALTEIDILPAAGSFQLGSRFSLYGLKAA